MRRLFLVRHAKSSWADTGASDFDRPLNKRGRRDAPDMGERLAARSIDPQILMSSPAIRAIETARILSEELGYPESRIVEEESIYEASVPDLIQLVESLDDNFDSVMIVGHNPSVTDFANYLHRDTTDNIPTCGVVCLHLNIESWSLVCSDSGSLVFFDYPKRHSS